MINKQMTENGAKLVAKYKDTRFSDANIGSGGHLLPRSVRPVHMGGQTRWRLACHLRRDAIERPLWEGVVIAGSQKKLVLIFIIAVVKHPNLP